MESSENCLKTVKVKGSRKGLGGKKDKDGKK